MIAKTEPAVVVSTNSWRKRYHKMESRYSIHHAVTTACGLYEGKGETVGPLRIMSESRAEKAGFTPCVTCYPHTFRKAPPDDQE